MTINEYVNYNKTGHISSEAYEQYSTIEGLKWIPYDKYTNFIESININGQPIEIRSEPEKNKFVKQDNEGEIIRDEQGMALYLTDEEMNSYNLPLYTHSIAAFWNKKAIGLASDEWGSSGVWVVSDFQRKGIGTKLLENLHRLNPRLAKNKIGQMTNAGVNLTAAYHKKLVQKALLDGLDVPQNVLNEYPDLVKQNNVV